MINSLAAEMDLQFRENHITIESYYFKESSTFNFNQEAQIPDIMKPLKYFIQIVHF